MITWCLRFAIWATVLLAFLYLLLLTGIKRNKAVGITFGIGIPLLWWAAIYGCPT